MAQTTPASPKGDAASSTNGDAPAPAKTPAKTTYIAFVWGEGLNEDDAHDVEGWLPVIAPGRPKGGAQQEFSVPSGNVKAVQDTVLAALAAEYKDAKSFRIAVVSARFWADEEFVQEPPPPPSFKPKGK